MLSDVLPGDKKSEAVTFMLECSELFSTYSRMLWDTDYSLITCMLGIISTTLMLVKPATKCALWATPPGKKVACLYMYIVLVHTIHLPDIIARLRPLYLTLSCLVHYNLHVYVLC